MKRIGFIPDRNQRGLVLLLAALSLACAPAGRKGEEIHIAEESAIIIWDAASKTQHFIRRASFETKAKDFGFIVPTPSVPKLAEADDAAFRHLDRIITPPMPPMAAKGPVAAAAKSEPKVEVIAKQQVAGYDATVLSANDAGALDQWLKSNGYASSPELTEWYRSYIERKWIFTAFKIAKVEHSRRSGDTAVRMTFATDQPFFPYREPQPATAPDLSMPRRLDIYFLGNAKVDAQLESKAAWPGDMVWSKPLTGNDRAKLMRLLKLPDPGANPELRLTVFRDLSAVRPDGGDLRFLKTDDQSQVLSPYERHMKQSAGTAPRQSYADTPYEGHMKQSTETAPRQSFADTTTWDYSERWDPWDIIGHILAPLLLALVLIALLKILQLFWWIGRKVAGR